MGKYIEQLKILKTRGEGTAKLTDPPKSDEVMTVLSPGYPLVSKKMQWWKRILSCKTIAEYLTVMSEFRTTSPPDEEIFLVYQVANRKLAELKEAPKH